MDFLNSISLLLYSPSPLQRTDLDQIPVIATSSEVPNMVPESPLDSSAGKDEAADVTKCSVDERTNGSQQSRKGPATGGDVVVDVPENVGGVGDARSEEKLCRICHLSCSDCLPRPVDLIVLGCRCRNDLGTAHRSCAQRWFRAKGNRCCEICGEVARNVIGIRDHGTTPEWNDMIRSSHVYMTVERRYQPFFIFFVAGFLILALYWIFYEKGL